MRLTWASFPLGLPLQNTVMPAGVLGEPLRLMLALCMLSLLTRTQGASEAWYHVSQLDVQTGSELSSHHTASGWAVARTRWDYTCFKRQSGILHEKCIFSWEYQGSFSLLPNYRYSSNPRELCCVAEREAECLKAQHPTQQAGRKATYCAALTVLQRSPWDNMCRGQPVSRGKQMYVGCLINLGR